MQNSKPRYGNLQARAHRLGLVVTKMTTDEDARACGAHEYVLTSIDATQEQKDNARLQTLYGIRHEIESIEKGEAVEAKDLCGNVVKSSDPDYADFVNLAASVSRDNPVDVRRAHMAKASSILADARILRAEKEIISPYCTEPEYIESVQRSMIYSMAAMIGEMTTFAESMDKDPIYGLGRLIFKAEVVVMSVGEYEELRLALRTAMEA